MKLELVVQVTVFEKCQFFKKRQLHDMMSRVHFRLMFDHLELLTLVVDDPNALCLFSLKKDWFYLKIKDLSGFLLTTFFSPKLETLDQRG